MDAVLFVLMLCAVVVLPIHQKPLYRCAELLNVTTTYNPEPCLKKFRKAQEDVAQFELYNDGDEDDDYFFDDEWYEEGDDSSGFERGANWWKKGDTS